MGLHMSTSGAFNCNSVWCSCASMPDRMFLWCIFPMIILPFLPSDNVSIAAYSRYQDVPLEHEETWSLSCVQSVFGPVSC